MSYLLINEDNEDTELFVDWLFDLSLDEYAMNELGYENIQELYDILIENMNTHFLHRIGNMWQSHRRRDTYSHAKPYYRKVSNIYRLEDQMKKHEQTVSPGSSKEAKWDETSERLRKIHNAARNKLGEDHPYTKKKLEELSNHVNGDISYNYGLNKSTDKKLSKRYNLMKLGDNGEIKKGNSIEGKYDNKTGKTKYKQIHGQGPVNILKDTSREFKKDFPISFESHHRKMNVRAEQARERFEKYLSGIRKHLQRDKEGNVIKNSKGRPLYYYDKNDRDEKTGKIIGKAKEYTDEEYGKAHDKNTATKVNPAREKLIAKGVGMPVFNLKVNDNGERNISSTRQYNSKTGELDSKARLFKRFHINKHEDKKEK